MKLILVILPLLLSLSAQASYMESCEFEAKIKAVTNLVKMDGTVRNSNPVIVVELKKVIADTGSHNSQSCVAHLDRDTVVLDVERHNDFKIDTRIRLKYRYINSLSPNGVVSAETWTLNN